MKKTFKLVMKKNVEGNEWVVRVYINGKYDEGKTYYGDDNKEDVEASMLDMRRKLKKDGYEEEIKEELEEIKTLVDQILEEKKGKKKKKGKKGKNSRGVFGYGFGYNNDDTVGDGDSDGVGISEGQDISDAVGEFFELMVNLPIHSSPPLYFWKELVDSSKIAKSAYDKNRGIGRN